MASQRTNDVREWIMFFTAIALIVFFAFDNADLNVFWLMLIAAMLGLSILVTGAQKTFKDLGKDAAKTIEKAAKAGDPAPAADCPVPAKPELTAAQLRARRVQAQLDKTTHLQPDRSWIENDNLSGHFEDRRKNDGSNWHRPERRQREY